MNEKEMLMKQLRANAFPHNNGKVMQAINIIRHSYNRLTDVQQAAQIWGVSQDDFLDCINYLAMAKYIQLRTIADKILVPDFADIGWDLLEAKLTAEGISVLCHKTKDEMIEVWYEQLAVKWQKGRQPQAQQDRHPAPGDESHRRRDDNGWQCHLL